MRLVQMGRHFVEGEERSGCGMSVRNEGGTTILKYGADTLATISDRTENGFTLTLHHQERRYSTTALCNRYSAVFQGVSDIWSLRRYTTFQRNRGVRIYDTKLELEVVLVRDTTFTVKDKAVSLNYLALEDLFLQGDKAKVEIQSSTPATANTNEALNNLMALMANI